MKKNIWFPIIGVVLGGLALVFGQTGAVENGFTLEKYHNADAKFLGDQIITSVVFGSVDFPVDTKVCLAFKGSDMLLYDSKTGKLLADGSL